MNIALLLTPKRDIVTLSDTMTLRQAMEKMEYHKYAAVPVIDENGKYQYTLSEGDILWFLKKEMDLNLKESERVCINDIERSRNMVAVSINASFEHVIDLIKFQNFVPVLDDSGIFIGMIKRGDVMKAHFAKKDYIPLKKQVLSWANA